MPELSDNDYIILYDRRSLPPLSNWRQELEKHIINANTLMRFKLTLYETISHECYWAGASTNKWSKYERSLSLLGHLSIQISGQRHQPATVPRLQDRHGLLAWFGFCPYRLWLSIFGYGAGYGGQLRSPLQVRLLTFQQGWYMISLAKAMPATSRSEPVAMSGWEDWSLDSNAQLIWARDHER